MADKAEMKDARGVRWCWRREGVLAVLRGGALFLGAFALLNVAGDWIRPGFDANEWWIDLRAMQGWLATGLMVAGGVAMVGFALVPRMRRWRFLATAGLLAWLAVEVAANVWVFYRLARWGGGGVNPSVMVPFSALVELGLVMVLGGVGWAYLRPKAGEWMGGVRGCVRTVLLMVLGVVGCGVAFPLGQMICFGKTDYRRKADVIVVFGAKVFADGKLSDAAEERVTEAVRLYREGLAGRMIMSGGPGDGAIYEGDAMRAYAMEMGVPGEVIEVDRAGLNTEATVRNTTNLARAAGARRILAVSHFYHLPRVKMAYERAGWDGGAGGSGEVYTVPVHAKYVLRGLPRFMLREVVALWAYYGRAA